MNWFSLDDSVTILKLWQIVMYWRKFRVNSVRQLRNCCSNSKVSFGGFFGKSAKNKKVWFLIWQPMPLNKFSEIYISHLPASTISLPPHYSPLFLFPQKMSWKVEWTWTWFWDGTGWRIFAAETGTRYKIAPIVLVCTRDACFRLFLCVWYRQHRNSYLERVQQTPRNEVSQDLMRFWSYESLFWTIL